MGPRYRRWTRGRTLLYAPAVVAWMQGPDYLVSHVQNQRDGLCCPGCVAGRADYDGRLAYNARTTGISGTAVFLWPIPRQWTCPAG